MSEFRGYRPPAYTQVPNEFFDAQMAQISTLSELKVVLAAFRLTFGWHKQEEAISISRFEKITGLSRQAVIDGIAAATAHNILIVTGNGKRGVSVYKLNICSHDGQGQGTGDDVVQRNRRSVKNDDQSNPLTSTGQQIRPVTSMESDTYKYKDTKNILSAAQRAETGSDHDLCSAESPSEESARDVADKKGADIFTQADLQTDRAGAHENSHQNAENGFKKPRTTPFATTHTQKPAKTEFDAFLSEIAHMWDVPRTSTGWLMNIYNQLTGRAKKGEWAKCRLDPAVSLDELRAWSRWRSSQPWNNGYRLPSRPDLIQKSICQFRDAPEYYQYVLHASNPSAHPPSKIITGPTDWDIADEIIRRHQAEAGSTGIQS